MFHSSTNPSLFGRPSGASAIVRELTSTADALRDLAVSLTTDDSDAAGGASRKLSDFEGRLSAYFDAEEGCGYFATLGQTDETFRTRVDAFQRTRSDLRHTVACLRRLARSTVVADACDLGHRIGDVVDEFDRHEVAEAELLQDFFRHDHFQPLIGGAP